jgi:hypothetical protein
VPATPVAPPVLPAAPPPAAPLALPPAPPLAPPPPALPSTGVSARLPQAALMIATTQATSMTRAVSAGMTCRPWRSQAALSPSLLIAGVTRVGDPADFAPANDEIMVIDGSKAQYSVSGVRPDRAHQRLRCDQRGYPTRTAARGKWDCSCSTWGS